MVDRRLIPRSLRVPAAVLAAAAAVVLVVLGARYAGDDSGGRVDGHLDQAVDALPPLRLGMLASFGAPAVVVLLAVLVGAVCAYARWWRAALLAVAGPGVTGLVTTFGKPLVDRTIGGGLAFPSGHTGGATSLALAVALIVAAALRLGATATATLGIACALVAGGVVGTGMVVRGAHYPTDVVGGFCAAVAAVLVAALVLDHVVRRREAASA